MEKQLEQYNLLMEKEEKSNSFFHMLISKDLCGLSSDLMAKLFKEIAREQLDSEPVYRGWWFDEVRSEDIMMCFNRLRGLEFKDRV